MRKIVSIPSNITSDDKTDKSPLPPSKLVPNLTTSAPPNSKTTAIQIVTSLPQNSISGTIVLPSGVKSSPGSFTLVTSSSPNTPVNNSLFFISSSPTNSLLKPPNAKIGSPLASTSKTDMVDATSLEPSLIPSLAISSVPMNSTPILITSTPSPSVTAIASPSIPEKINVPPTESNGTSVAPLEHITLSEEQVSEVPESDVDPLDLGETTKPQSEPFSSDDESDAPASIPEKMNKDAEKKNGLLGYQLYRCAFCDFSCSNSNDFKKHVSRSMACRKVNNPAKPFECVHCGKGLRNPHVFIDHIQIHGVLRFSCSLCGNKFPTATQARGHMKHRHNVNQISLTPLNPTKNNVDTDEKVLKVSLLASISMDDTVYTPDQIDSIPIRSIFSSDIRCGICSYSTKVRTNLVRHLQFHSQEKSVPDTAPVNPVPCLEKNEKMFDKMMNLASSSHTSASRMGGSGKPDNKAENLPEYVSPQYRYCCCAQNCNYICPEEGNLRHHLMALHNDETSFTCAHCKADITPTDVDNIIKHLKLHGLQLFKCSHCDFVHYQKNKVEKHVNDHHADLPSKVITVRYMESEPKDPTEELSLLDGPSTPTNNQLKSKDKPWRCCMCKTRNNSQEGIQNHVLEKHEIDSQYKCALCAYKTNEKDTFEEHFKDHHTNQEINIIHVYRKVEDGPKDDKDKDADPFDTTPLWQRDRPRVRHIRGILFDESSPVPAKSPKKPPKAVTTPTSSASTSKATSNLDLAIDSVAKGTNILKDDELIQQVNKIMKNSKESPSKTNDSDSDVIIIEDEDEISDESKTTKTKGSLKRKTIEVAGISKIPRLEDVIDLANMSAVEEKYDEYSPENLKGAFGEFGQPLNRQLKCPVCNKFKSKRISDFIFHMFKEKKVYRFKCGICSDESITYRYMAKHVKEHKHDTDFRDKIIELPANPRLEVWIQMLISFQCSKILPSLNPVPEASIPKDQRELCRYCNKWFRSEQERNEHAISHWRIVPHGCESCHFLAFTKAQVEKHNEQSHANVIMNIIEKGPTVTNEIKHTDDLHRMEAEDRTHKDKPSIAEVIVTASQPLDMEDESQQDGTVEGMTSVGEGSSLLDESSTSAETNPLEICEITDVDDFESPDDLFIITKTDTNVPVDGDVYCCEYCPYMSSSEMLIMSHISGQHEHMHIKFKVLNNGMCESKKSDYVGCALCTETGSEIRIRKHHLDKHDGQTFMMFRYTCTTCQKRFMKLPGLKTHSIRTHPGVPVRYTGIFDNTVQDAGKPQKKKAAPDETDPTGLKPNKPKPLYKRTWKTYQCSKCPYRRDFASNNVNNVRVHVRSHFKAYSCGECRMKFKSNTEATHHYNKDHPEQTEDMSINFDEIIEDEYQVTIAAVFRDAFVIVKDSTSPPPSPVQPPKTLKSTARKSTSAPQKTPQEEYSFYGLPVEEVDLTKISTSVEINGMRLNMSADKLGKIFDLDPQVQVKDCNDTVDLTGLFDS
ncbi:hypothetical protein JTB14_028744 [Gonioctena quinquepunctata]|nr:hypothetical protein JTB14_028744 [Gonioctena quinquepunctata]